MKISLLFLLFFIQNVTFSQEKLSYYFDNELIENIKDYKNNFSGKSIYLTNSKDSTYNLFVKIGNNIKKATIDDSKNRWMIYFDANFEYTQINDIKKLSNCRQFRVVQKTTKKYRNFVENFEFEKDTINNKTYVHLTIFKNKKRKKIIGEHYYVFGKNNLNNNFKYSIKNYLLNKYNLDLHEENLEKVLQMEDGKLVKETNLLSITKVDFNFNFKIDEVFPKYSYSTNTTLNQQQ